jgi:hypothetical protein
MTKDEAQRRRWIFYEVVILVFLENLRRVPDVFLLSEGKDKRPWRYRGAPGALKRRFHTKEKSSSRAFV